MVSIVADHPDAVDALAVAAQGGPPLSVLVDIDPDIHRTGVASPDAAVALARRISERPPLRYGGVQFYCGSQQHISGFAGRRTAIADRTAYLSGCLDRLVAAGLAPAVVTGGGTGSHAVDAELGVLTELQAGSYVFMDREYGECDLDGKRQRALRDGVDGRRPRDQRQHGRAGDDRRRAEGVRNRRGRSIDHGRRARGRGDTGSWATSMARSSGLICLQLGGLVTLMTPHCDPTANLYDAYHVVRGDTLVAIWPVTARGRSA